MRITIVQHGQKERVRGDPGLTDRGWEQARDVGARLAAAGDVVAVWSSGLRRARETAGAVAGAVGIAEVGIDDRFRERVNWADGDFESFVAEWERSSADRAYVPRGGDSSADAAERFLAALDDVSCAASPAVPTRRRGVRADEGTIVVVAHGGVTTDVLRTLLGDDVLRDRAPAVIAEGVPSCAVTTLRCCGRAWTVEGIAT